MWIFIAILVIIVLYMIVLSASKTSELEEEKYKVDRNITKMVQENEELRALREQEIHNNTILLNKNKELQGRIYQIEDIINGKRIDTEARAKIKELLSV